ncbi:MAG: N-acetylmuramoyl-L-alanine amidase [Pseudomonadota bacterium]
MSRHSEIKQAVLRSVYEDNAGIPRSSHGKGRARMTAQPAADGRTSYRTRALVALLIGAIALFGINFRLVTVDGSGPVAMQVMEPDPRTLPLALLAGTADASLADDGQATTPEPLQVVQDAVATSGRYDSMLARLGMPMADLFNLSIQTIVIDPGHGGIDPGATGPRGLKEKDVVLDIAQRLRDKLARSGKYRVLLTREDDHKVFLKERVAFASEQRADLFISIHINSLPAGAEHLNYVETYYFGAHTDQQSLLLAEKENRDSDYLMGDFRKVIARIGDTFKTEESKWLAGAIHTHLFNNLKRQNPDLLNARAKTGPFMVLLGVDVPSVLVEVSCLSNRAEENRLSRPEYRDDVASYLEKGIDEYLEQRANRRTIDRGRTQHVAKQER